MKKLLLASLLLFPSFAFAEMDVNIDLNWAPPTENVDGTVLTDLGGYNVWYGFSQGGYTQSINVADNSATSFGFPVNGIASGTSIYVVMTAYDLEGNESAYSNEVVFGPFIETDTTAPAQPQVNGTATIVLCPTGKTCVF